jgi:hypothetical protein
LGKQQPDPDRILFWNTHGSQITRWNVWRIVKFRDEKSWRLYNIEADPLETTDLSDEHPEAVKTMAGPYDAWLAEMSDPVKPVRPPDELYEHTERGRHARRPFGSGWITVEEWDKKFIEPCPRPAPFLRKLWDRAV